MNFLPSHVQVLKSVFAVLLGVNINEKFELPSITKVEQSLSSFRAATSIKSSAKVFDFGSLSATKPLERVAFLVYIKFMFTVYVVLSKV